MPVRPEPTVTGDPYSRPGSWIETVANASMLAEGSKLARRVRFAVIADDRTTTDAASSVPLRSVAPSDTDVAISDAASSVPLRSSAVSDALDWMIDAAISVPLRSSPDAAVIDEISADTDVPARLVGDAVAESVASDCADAGLLWLRSSAVSDALDWMIDAASSVP